MAADGHAAIVEDRRGDGAGARGVGALHAVAAAAREFERGFERGSRARGRQRARAARVAPPARAERRSRSPSGLSRHAVRWPDVGGQPDRLPAVGRVADHAGVVVEHPNSTVSSVASRQRGEFGARPRRAGRAPTRRPARVRAAGSPGARCGRARSRRSRPRAFERRRAAGAASSAAGRSGAEVGEAVGRRGRPATRSSRSIALSSTAAPRDAAARCRTAAGPAPRRRRRPAAVRAASRTRAPT